MTIDKHRRVYLFAYKTFGKEKITKTLKPCLRSLFQAIKRIFKMTDMMWKKRMDKAKRLFHINFFIKVAKKKSIFSRQVLKWSSCKSW